MSEKASGHVDIANIVRTHVCSEFFPGGSAEPADCEPLISSGAMDSLSVLSLVGFLESQFRISVDAHEMSVENLDSIDDITAFVARKQAA